MQKYVSIGMVIIMLLSFSVSTIAEELHEIDLSLLDEGHYVCTYEEHHANGVGESVFTLKKIPGGYQAIWDGITDTTDVYTDTDFRTHKVMITDEDTSLTIERDGNRLLVSGIDAGESIDKTLKLTSPHWYHLLPLSLMEFTRSDKQSVKFSLFDPYNIKIRDMRVEKQGFETITIFDEEYEAVKMSMRMRGILTPFWKSDIWTAAESGTHLKYEGLNIVPKIHKSKIYLKQIEFKPN